MKVGKDIKLVEESYIGLSGFIVVINMLYNLNLFMFNVGISVDIFVKYVIIIDKVYIIVKMMKGGISYLIGLIFVIGMNMDNFVVNVLLKIVIFGI